MPRVSGGDPWSRSDGETHEATLPPTSRGESQRTRSQTEDLPLLRLPREVRPSPKSEDPRLETLFRPRRSQKLCPEERRQRPS